MHLRKLRKRGKLKDCKEASRSGVLCCVAFGLFRPSFFLLSQSLKSVVMRLNISRHVMLLAYQGGLRLWSERVGCKS